MEVADYWLVEKQLVHKLFKVLVPRYENYNVSYTRMFNAPQPFPYDGYKKAVLELRGNPYPSLVPDSQSNRNLIQNVLLDEAKKAYRSQKYKEIAKKIDVEVKGNEVTPTLQLNKGKPQTGPIDSSDVLDESTKGELLNE